MMDAFYALENVGMAIIDLRGNMLVATGWQDVCTKFHRLHPETSQHCAESDVALSAGVAPGKFKLYRCKNGLWDMATPIVVGERHVGNFFLGQFFFDDEQPDVEFFRAQARRYGFDEADYLAALGRVPRWSREKVDRAMTFYARLAQQISEMGFRNLQSTQALARQRRAEEELRDSKRIIEGIIHAIPARVFWKDRNLVFLGCNDAFARDAGFASPQDVVGKDDFQMAWRDQAELYRADDRQVIDSGTPKLLIEEPQTTPDGKTLALLTSKIPLRNARGEIVGVLGTYLDVTERKRTEERLRLHAQLLDSVTESVVASDLEGRILYWGPGAEKLYGYAAAEVMGRPYRNFAGSVEPPDEEAFRKEILAKGSWQGEHVQKNRDGQTFWTSTLIALVRDERGRPTGYIGIDRDISEQKRTGDVLCRANRALQALNHCRQILMAAQDEQNLMDNICRLLVAEGGYRLVWIGFAETDAGKTVRPVAQAGLDTGYLDSLRITWADTELGHGPTGEAIRTGQPAIARQIAQDPVFAPWRTAALAHGYASSIALPLRGEDACLGALNLYAAEPDAFDPAEVEWLAGLANDLAFGLLNLRQRSRRERAEAALRDSEAQLSNALEIANAGHWEYDVDSDTFTFNDNFYRIFRTTAENEGGYRMSSAEYARRFCHPDDMALVGQETRAAIASRDPHYHRQIEHRIRYADGATGHIAVRFFVVQDAQGRTVKTRGVNQDITAYKRAEEILQAGEARYRTFIEATSDLVFLKDEAFRYLISNAANNAFLGQSEADVIGRTDFDLMPRAVADRCRASDQAALDKGICIASEEAVDEKTYQTLKFPVPLPDGRTGVGGYVRDITARKRADESLRASQRITEDIINAIPMRVFWKDRNLVYLGCNKAFARDAGFADPKELVGKDDFQMVWRKQAESYRADDRQVIESGQSKLFIEEPQTTPAGKTLTLLTSKIPLRNDQGEITGVLGTYMDITQHKLAEEKMRASTERFQDIAANIPGAIYQIQAGRTGALEVPYMSSGCETLFERPVAEMDFTGLLFDRMHLGDRALFEHSLAAAAQKLERWSLEFRIAVPDGRTKWLRASANPRTLPSGAVLWTGVLLDIDELKRTEDALRRSEAFQRHLMDAMPSPVFYKDRQGHYLGCNQAFEKFFGQTKTQLIGKTVFDVAPPDLAAIYHAKDMELIERPGIQIYDSQIQDAEGNRHDVVFHKASIPDNRGTAAGLVGIILDITDRKQAENQLAQQLDELRRWYAATLGRESRIAELKREINAQARRLGEPPPYPSTEVPAP